VAFVIKLEMTIIVSQISGNRL